MIDLIVLFFVSFWCVSRCLWIVWCGSHWIAAREVAMCTRRILPNPVSQSADTLRKTFATITIAEDSFITGELKWRIESHRFRFTSFEALNWIQRPIPIFIFLTSNPLSIAGHRTVILRASGRQNAYRDIDPWHAVIGQQFLMAIFNINVTLSVAPVNDYMINNGAEFSAGPLIIQSILCPNDGPTTRAPTIVSFEQQSNQQSSSSSFDNCQHFHGIIQWHHHDHTIVVGHLGERCGLIPRINGSNDEMWSSSNIVQIEFQSAPARRSHWMAADAGGHSL